MKCVIGFLSLHFWLESDAALGSATSAHAVPRCAVLWPQAGTAGRDVGCLQKVPLSLCGGCTGTSTIRGVTRT